MRRLVTLTCLVALGLSTTGCGFFNNLLSGFRGGDTESTEPSEIDETEAATEEPDVDAAEAEVAEDDELFKEAVLPGLPSAAEIALAELLPSTDANERLQQVENDRPDPYAFVPVPPTPSALPPVPEDTPAGQDVETVDNQETPAEDGGDGGADGGSFADSDPDGVTEPFVAPDDAFPPLDTLPPLPDPAVVASQVQIFGIAEMNGEVYAIVQAPNEPTSRYVREGDRLSNGAVLVKRIETRLSSEPLVVLEERGTEIALPVGAGGGAPDAGDATEEAAFQSPSQSSPEIAVLPLPELDN
ncbi:MAG: hypothetical protein ACFBSF_12715 [Leptolyngbyaceae cyanobacterium]